MNMNEIKKMYKVHPVMECIKLGNEYLMPLFNNNGIRVASAYSKDKKNWTVVQNEQEERNTRALRRYI